MAVNCYKLLIKSLNEVTEKKLPNRNRCAHHIVSHQLNISQNIGVLNFKFYINLQPEQRFIGHDESPW